MLYRHEDVQYEGQRKGESGWHWKTQVRY